MSRRYQAYGLAFLQFMKAIVLIQTQVPTDIDAQPGEQPPTVPQKHVPGDPAEDGIKIWNCSFAPQDNSSPPCNFTLSVAHYGLREWRIGSGREAFWLGGPNRDGEGLETGSDYAFYDTTKFYERNERLSDRAWILSPLTSPTNVQGNCLNFKFNTKGLNIESLNLIRIDLLNPLESRFNHTNNQTSANSSSQEELTPKYINALHDIDLSAAIAQTHEEKARQTGHTTMLTAYRFRTNVVWSAQDVTHGAWQAAHYSYASPQEHLFAWEVRPFLAGPVNGRTVFNGFAAIDSVQMTSDHCQETLCESPVCLPDECNFDADFCNFSNDAESDDFDWSLSRGSVRAGTGPMGDQSARALGTPGGGYAFIDSRYPQRPGDVATLVLGTGIELREGFPRCISFWLNLFGTGLGSLRVFAMPFPKLENISTSTPRSEFLVWEMKNPPSSPRDDWNQAKFTLSSSRGNQTVQLVFEGVVGEVGRSDIAIDTIKFEHGPCPLFPESASPNLASHFPADCTFLLGFCHWSTSRTYSIPESSPRNKQASLSPLRDKPNLVRRPRQEESDLEQANSLWNRVRGGTDGAPPGHTRYERGDEDFFAAFDTRNYRHQPLQMAHLYSPILHGTPLVQTQDSNDTESVTNTDEDVGNQCVGFWYQMASAIATNPYLGTLKILAIEANATDSLDSIIQKKTIWSLTNSQGAIWQYGQAPFNPTANGRRLAIQGVRANTVSGVMAIDDIVVFNGECEVHPPQAQTDPHDCSFDNGLCSWAAVNPGGTTGEVLRPQDWRLADSRLKVGNIKDHTFQVEKRGFLYFDTANIQVLTWLVSGAITPSVDFCLTFWFRSAAVDGSNLSVKRQYKNGTSSLLWRIQHQDIPKMSPNPPVSSWIPAQVPVDKGAEPTLVIIEGSSNNGGFMLDDIQLLRDVPPQNCKIRPEYQSASLTRITNDLFSRRTLGSSTNYQRNRDQRNALNLARWHF